MELENEADRGKTSNNLWRKSNLPCTGRWVQKCGFWSNTCLI